MLLKNGAFMKDKVLGVLYEHAFVLSGGEKLDCEGELIHDKNTFCLPREYLQEHNGRICDDVYG